MKKKSEKEQDMKELKKEEKEKISGGKALYEILNMTKFCCTDKLCRTEYALPGDHMGEVIKCPKCEKYTMVAVSYTPGFSRPSGR